MKKLMSVVPVACVAFAALMMATPASAQCGGGGGGFGFGGGPFGFGFSGVSSPYVTGRIPTPPYFALHPPVYYSAPVARTYGYSPFPYPGSVRTPEVAPFAAMPKMIANPYVQPVSHDKVETESEAKDDVAQDKSLMFINPYVDATEPSEIKLATVKYSGK